MYTIKRFISPLIRDSALMYCLDPITIDRVDRRPASHRHMIAMCNMANERWHLSQPNTPCFASQRVDWLVYRMWLPLSPLHQKWRKRGGVKHHFKRLGCVVHTLASLLVMGAKESAWEEVWKHS